MAQDNKAFKELVEIGKEHGYLTLDEINKSLTSAAMNADDIDGLMGTLEDLGIQVVDRKKYKAVAMAEKEAYTEEWASNMDISNSIRMYLSEMGKVPLLTRDEEVTLARNIREREKELRKIVLESPITMREICSWEELVDQEEMTTKELMPRGKRTTRELNTMRKKLKEAAAFIAKREKDISSLMKEIRKPGLSDKLVSKYTSQLEEKQKEVVDRIIKLNLNQNKIKRLTNRIKGLADKINEYKSDIARFDEYFGKYEDVVKLYKQFEQGKLSESALTKKTKDRKSVV